MCYKAMVLYSKIVTSNKSTRVKATPILNELIAPHCHNQVNDFFKFHPCSAGRDCSKDTGTEKMNLVKACIFDMNHSKVVTYHFLSICVTSGEHCC